MNNVFLCTDNGLYNPVIKASESSLYLIELDFFTSLKISISHNTFFLLGNTLEKIKSKSLQDCMEKYEIVEEIVEIVFKQDIYKVTENEVAIFTKQRIMSLCIFGIQSFQVKKDIEKYPKVIILLHDKKK